MGNLPANKIALLHVARRDLGLSETDYRAVLLREGGVESTRDLDELGFLKVMKHFSHAGFKSTWSKRTYGNRAGMASPAQVDLVRRLWRDYHGGEDEGDRTLNAWLSRFHHVSALRFVTVETASNIIHALKRMGTRIPKARNLTQEGRK